MPPRHSAIPATLVARHLRHERDSRLVLDDVSLSVTPATCLGVVGPNGVGKSTLLQILAGLLEPSGGRVVVDPPAAAVGYLHQEHLVEGHETVHGALRRRTGVAAAEAGLTRAASEFGSASASASARYEAALAHYEAISAGDFEARLVTTLDAVGLGADLADQPVRTLSGGQEARVALAAVLLSRFAVTLLDEPTNDLDFEGLELLEQLVARRFGGMVIVSHDRAFLDRAVTDVLELDEHRRTGRLYGGGWSGYVVERETDRAHAEEAFARYEARRSTLRRRAQRERQWATRGVAREKKDPRDNDKAQRDFRINRTERLAARSRRTERALDALEVVEKPWEGWDLRFGISEAARSGDVVARLDEAVIERGEFELGPLDWELSWGDRVVLVGPNGSGKTTLVDAVLGRLPLARGRRQVGPSVVVGELVQDRRTSPGPASVLERFTASTGLTDERARAQLAKFGLGADAVMRAPASLSPGERTRAELAVFAARGVNLLVLDEPTNHLDLPAIEELESSLESYGGTLLMVSHDRRLLDSVRLTRRVELPAPGAALRQLRETPVGGGDSVDGPDGRRPRRGR